ncbi:alpha/beta fold hydrolase [Kitasatospora sp. NPDC057692]|uniref:alpha/beta fold hydrolase n=1 Tax=Kitasatospora sp. NPDC057692 TaxID=3346215 RepID=UPI0036775F37
MTEFVLVAGAWLGAWAWDDVLPDLRAAGHGVHPLTLSGLAERRGEPAGQQTHVQDIVDLVEERDLREVVLVGHSYSGIPVGQAAERIGDRLARLVLVDANIPVDGQAFVGAGPWGSAVAEAIGANGGFWPPLTAADFAGQGLTGEQTARIVAGSTPHPGGSLTEPAALAGPLAALPATYLTCLLDSPEPPPAVAALLRDAGWQHTTLDTGHWPMFSEPAALAAVLLAAASR